MQHRRLGRTDIEVSQICLGTMTWGEQNSEAEAHAQLDAALDRGVTFIDTAEMYPVPPNLQTQGRTESCIGSWLASRGGRDRIVLATKVSGRGRNEPIRGKETRLDHGQITAAIDASLKRLRTDYVDLYQTHWPDRQVNSFGQLGYMPQPEKDADTVPLEETLGTFADLIRAGKLRAVGLSNDTPWGLMRCLHLADTMGLPRVASIQNAYNLLNRSFEVGLAEIADREDVGLLAYSPLAMATLTGKYLDGARPPGARLTLFERFRRYSNAEGQRATAEYVALARRHGIDPGQMALAFVNSRPFVTASIIGATSLEQLARNIDSIHVSLSPEVLQEIEAIHRGQPNPCP